MRYKIHKDGQPVNTIVADEAFVSGYCERHGYTWEEDPLPAAEPEPAEVTTAEMAGAIQEGVDEV